MCSVGVCYMLYVLRYPCTASYMAEYHYLAHSMHAHVGIAGAVALTSVVLAMLGWMCSLQHYLVP